MMKKGSSLLIVLLLSLPGCFGRKKSDVDGKGHKMEKGQKMKGHKMAAASDEFNDVNVPLASADDLEIDETMRSFFDDMDEFVQFAQEGDFDLADADDTDSIKNDEFAWADADDEQKLETVYFGFNKAKIDKAERAKINHNIEKAKKLLDQAKTDGMDATLVVDGHSCSSAGSDAYNMALSEKRAKEVTDQLIAAGIDREVIKTVGRGTEMLVVPSGDKDDQWANRRAEMHLVYS